MEDGKELDPSAIYGIIKKRIWLIIIVTILTTLIATIVSIFLNSPTYKSEVGILIGKQNVEKITDKDVDFYEILSQTYRDIAVTNKVAETAANKLDNKVMASDLLSRTTITENTGTMIIKISVVSNTPDSAYKEVKAYSEAFVERAEELKISNGVIEIIDDAKKPVAPVNSRIKRNIEIGFVLGIMLSVSLAFLLEYISSKKQSA